MSPCRLLLTVSSVLLLSLALSGCGESKPVNAPAKKADGTQAYCKAIKKMDADAVADKDPYNNSKAELEKLADDFQDLADLAPDAQSRETFAAMARFETATANKVDLNSDEGKQAMDDLNEAGMHMDAVMVKAEKACHVKLHR
jgi:hypothetical protein